MQVQTNSRYELLYPKTNVDQVDGYIKPWKVGDVLVTSRNDLSDNWLLCNGADFSKEDYPLLPQTQKKVSDLTWTFDTPIIERENKNTWAHVVTTVFDDNKVLYFTMNSSSTFKIYISVDGGKNWSSIENSLEFSILGCCAAAQSENYYFVSFVLSASTTSSGATEYSSRVIRIPKNNLNYHDSTPAIPTGNTSADQYTSTNYYSIWPVSDTEILIRGFWATYRSLNMGSWERLTESMLRTISGRTQVFQVGDTVCLLAPANGTMAVGLFALQNGTWNVLGYFDNGGITASNVVKIMDNYYSQTSAGIVKITPELNFTQVYAENVNANYGYGTIIKINSLIWVSIRSKDIVYTENGRITWVLKSGMWDSAFTSDAGFFSNGILGSMGSISATRVKRLEYAEMLVSKLPTYTPADNLSAYIKAKEGE